MLILADRAFFVLHTLLIVFCMVGWAWRRTRLLHLIAMGLTAFSWFVLGAYHGWGYCLCTDWHFQVRRRLGYTDLESSYVQLLASRVVGVSLSPAASDWLAGIIFALIVIATVFVWGREWHRRRAGPRS